MVATVILGMLCVHLLCFSAMFFLISTRLHGKKLGTDIFALGNLLLGLAYLLQLAGGPAGWSVASLINHTLTLCAPVLYVLGGIRFFNRPTPVLRPIMMLAFSYLVAQIVVQNGLGPEARHALLAGSCALLFLAMVIALLYASVTFARDLRVEMTAFAVLVGGICFLNAAKFSLILAGGLPALDMNSRFQTVFYIYMSFLGTVLPPAAVWLVLRRLTDELRAMAAHDPLTGLLNRRGLIDRLETHFRSRQAGAAHVLIVDVDHFKQVNDKYGHKEGDRVLQRIAQTLQKVAREGDLSCRLGGEEFVVVALNTNNEGALLLAERIRGQIARSAGGGTAAQVLIRCTVTIGVSAAFHEVAAFDDSMQDADHALYRGKQSGRNRVETAFEPAASPGVFATLLPSQSA